MQEEAMNIEIKASLVKGEHEEDISINFDDDSIEYFLLQYLKENYNSYQLEDWCIIRVCID